MQGKKRAETLDELQPPLLTKLSSFINLAITSTWKSDLGALYIPGKTKIQSNRHLFVEKRKLADLYFCLVLLFSWFINREHGASIEGSRECNFHL